jgi:hypothetical protein
LDPSATASRDWREARRCAFNPTLAVSLMLTLYGDLDSGNVYKVRLLLA